MKHLQSAIQELRETQGVLAAASYQKTHEEAYKMFMSFMTDAELMAKQARDVLQYGGFADDKAWE